jgi:hypothetical protein
MTMGVITFLIAVVALIIAILAYQRAGGTADLKRQIESRMSSPDMKKQRDALVTMTDSFRGKAADALDRLEKLIRKKEKGQLS